MIQNEIFGPVITVQSSPTRTKRCGGPTASSTGWRRRCGRRTTAGRCGCRAGSTSAASGSTATSRWWPRCRTAGSSIRLRQGPLGVRARGLHPHQARHAQHRLLILGAWNLPPADAVSHSLRNDTAAHRIAAELVANVATVAVIGDTVSPTDTLVLLESMKMEIPVLAEVSGVVADRGRPRRRHSRG